MVTILKVKILISWLPAFKIKNESISDDDGNPDPSPNTHKGAPDPYSKRDQADPQPR